MNNLPFGTAVYRQFETTFLASVIMGMTYPPIHNDASRKDKWGLFSRAMFSIDPVEGIFEKPIFVNRSDHKLVYVFANNIAQVHISGDGYQSFADSLIPHAYKLKQFVTEVAGVNAPTQLGIRKINVFQLEADNAKRVEEEAVRKHFLSTSYCNLREGRVPLGPEDTQIPGMMKHQWTEGSNQLTLRSAFLKVQGFDNMFRLVLDIDEQHNPIEGVNLDKLDGTLKEMNMDLFNAFMWCVSDNVLKIMKNGRK